MFHFTGYRALFPISFRKRRWPTKATGLPHSEISGSKRMCRSPKLIAACHVLHRLLAPRHPLCALKSLIPCLKSAVTTEGSDRSGPPIHNGPARTPALAVKNFAFGNQNIFKDRKNGSRDSRPAFTQSLCSLSNHISLHTDVKERTLSSVCAVKPSFPGADGGPGRTRTYDPRLIKAVL